MPDTNSQAATCSFFLSKPDPGRETPISPRAWQSVCEEGAHLEGETNCSPFTPPPTRSPAPRSRGEAHLCSSQLQETCGGELCQEAPGVDMVCAPHVWAPRS